MKNDVKKPVVMVLTDYYLPGYKCGGAMRQIVNTVERLGDTYDFKIVTRDHDGPYDKTSYTTVKINDWNQVGKADVYYLSKDKINLKGIREVILDLKPELIYATSYFGLPTIHLMLLRKLRLIPEINTIVAPSGELSVGALQLKPVKKKAFITLAKAVGLYRNVIWKTASDLEKNEIPAVGRDEDVRFVAYDMPPKIILPGYKESLKPEKKPGSVKMVFLSRISRKKNLSWLLELLENYRKNLELDVWGPIEDDQYWSECESLMKKIKPPVKVNYQGSIDYEQVPEKLSEYHFFILPTLGENFGHVFIEALAAGCPVIGSDRTLWNNLKKKNIGWDLPLEEPEKWFPVLDECVEMDQNNYTDFSKSAREYAVKWLGDEKLESNTRNFLDYGIGK